MCQGGECREPTVTARPREVSVRVSLENVSLEFASAGGIVTRHPDFVDFL